ncbi:hypothetical protein CTAYLR_000135 [Chrysophaeum taylorii]|uniref:FYVE-type domain-containing protein n=1 Tax=Chrysophaeum taylorii TaxID=2483200 RepID=A0AAD7UGX6_9STRA|nr:hypothetical protein CTAYLR_000135 [Chrysophaeum taylorii]
MSNEFTPPVPIGSGPPEKPPRKPPRRGEIQPRPQEPKPAKVAVLPAPPKKDAPVLPPRQDEAPVPQQREAPVPRQEGVVPLRQESSASRPQEVTPRALKPKRASALASMASIAGLGTSAFRNYERDGGGAARGAELAEVLGRTATVLREGCLRKVNRGGSRKYVFVLTEDALVYARPVPTSQRLDLNRDLPLETITIKQSEQQPGFCVMSPSKSFVALANSSGESDAWRAAIERCANARRAVLGLAPPNETAPVWTEDADADDCQNCGTPFTLLRRRHHCRKCGRLVCHSCSAEKIPLPSCGGLQRVCNPCHADYVDTRAYGVPIAVASKKPVVPKNQPPPAAEELPPKRQEVVEPPKKQPAEPQKKQPPPPPPRKPQAKQPPPPPRDYSPTTAASSPGPPPPPRDYSTTAGSSESPSLAAARKAAAARRKAFS